jgi:hypothetical protein
MRRQIQVLAAAMALALAPALAAEIGAQEVGVVVQAEGQVTGTPAGGSQAPLAVPDPVLLDMRVATGRASYARMTFGSAGVLELGAGAEVVLDRSTVDAATGAEDSLLGVIAGKVRLALSSLFRGSVEVDTPTATIGVKGTILTTEVPDPDLTVVWVEEGTVDVTSKAGGTVTVTAGYSTSVRRGAAPTAPAPFDPESGAAAVRALPPEIVAPNEEVEPPVLRPRDQELPPPRDDVPPGPNDPSGIPVGSRGNEPAPGSGR